MQKYKLKNGKREKKRAKNAKIVLHRLLLPLYTAGGAGFKNLVGRFQDFGRRFLHDRSGRSVLLRGLFRLERRLGFFGIFALRTEEGGRGRRGPYRVGLGRMAKQLRADAHAHAVHGG